MRRKGKPKPFSPFINNISVEFSVASSLALEKLCLLLHPTPTRLEKKKKLIVYDDNLGSALTVHTVPTSLARSQAWPSARTTITNTGSASQEGVGQPTQPRSREGSLVRLGSAARSGAEAQGRVCLGRGSHQDPRLFLTKQSLDWFFQVLHCCSKPWSSSVKWFCATDPEGPFSLSGPFCKEPSRQGSKEISSHQTCLLK